MHKYLVLVVACCLNAHAECMQNVSVKLAKDYRVEVTSSTAFRKMTPAFFGFNLEWLQFQLGFWDQAKQGVDSGIIDALQDFSGAVYRYPGGISANHFNWQDGVNEITNRPLRNLESWIPPTRISFGPDEYLSFVRTLNGVPWYVANLYGNKNQAFRATEMAAQAGGLAKHLNQSSSLTSIYRWELGNELDRGDVRWPPEKIGATAMLVAQKIRAQNSQARFVVGLQEYPAMKSEGFSAEEYNTALVDSTREAAKEYAIHLYYDDKPDGITVDKQMRAVCEAIRHTHTKPVVWVTEHGFIPKGAWETADWKKLWPQTADMKAALNVADFQIAAAQIPNIQGTMIHSLHGTGGPWPMFHRNENGAWNEGAVLQALRILRKSMLPNMLQTTSYSAHRSSYNGGYDMRATVMANDARTQHAIWAINRSNQAISLKVKLNGNGEKAYSIQQESLTGLSPEANNYSGSGQVHSKKIQSRKLADNQSYLSLSLPAYSVNAFKIE